tara:strand:+ start:4030 stop:4902 length:873 start_codon:yes stop_codon:yes gene_type:complete
MKFKFFLIAIMTSLLFLFSCSDSNDTGSGYGKLGIQLTDAPFPTDLVAEANVTIYKIEARYTANTVEEDETASESEENSSFVVLMEEEVNVNLLELTNGITQQLVDIDVPAGYYDLIRVYVKGVNVVLNDEMATTYDLNVPSGEQTGIKIFIKPGLEVKSGLSEDLLLDFDVSKSFVAIGGHNNLSGFNFKPVIKVSNLTTTGTLSGVVSTTENDVVATIPGATITISQVDEIITSSIADDNGMYTIMGLEAGNYTVTIEIDGYTTQVIENVEINVGNKTVLDFDMVMAP